MTGGAGNNIPCDLFNEHTNKLLKYIIRNMGSNLTESSIHRAARSITTLQQICESFDAQSGVPCHTTAHSTRLDKDDIKKVVSTVLKNKLLVEVGQRNHRSFKHKTQSLPQVGCEENRKLDQGQDQGVSQVSWWFS